MPLSRRDKWLLTFSTMPITGVILAGLVIAALYAVFIWGSASGTVKRAVYVAKDEQSFRILEQAVRDSEDLATVSNASGGQIFELKPRTHVRYEARLYYDGQNLTKHSTRQEEEILKVKIEKGPYHGVVVLMDARDVAFYSFL